jgi:NAD(P)H-dependent FMN reductase
MALAACKAVAAAGGSADYADLRELPLPFCDGRSSYGHPNVKNMAGRIDGSDAVILATPVYNYDANSAAKNLIENTGRNWTGKTVGFLCAAGGDASYMSIMAMANSLMLDFRCLIIPRFVYASGKSFEGGEIIDPEILDRISELSREVLVMARARASLSVEEG